MSGAAKGTATAQAAAAPAEDLTQLSAPEEFRRAITKDPFASTYRFDFDAARGGQPIAATGLPIGGAPIPRDGFYFDLDGVVVDYYHAGGLFPKFAAVSGAGGHYFFVTDNLNATTSDLLYIILRSGWEGNVLDIYVL